VQEAITLKIRSFPGLVKAKSNVELAFSVDGVLVELKARESRRVRKGEVVARLDERDFRNAHDAAKANFLRSDSEFRRASTLHKKDVVSQSEFDTAKATVDVARAEFEISKKAIEDTIIVAPFDGLVAQRYVENNEHVKKYTPILALKDISEIEIVIQMPERLMAQSGIHKFKDIKASFDIDNNQWFPCKVKEYSVQADPVTRTFEVAVSLQAPDDLKVLPGMTATVKASTASTLNENHTVSALALVPVESVFADSEGKSYIWRIPDTRGKPQKIEVTLGAMNGDSIELMSGLEPGVRIATAGIHSLSENMLVRPMKDGGEGLDG
jgi:RND family efflux transporter MFP subunit